MAIARFTEQNIGSLILIEYVPGYAIAAFNNTGSGTIPAAGIVLANGFAWERIYCSPDTMGHQQDEQLGDNLESFSQQVVGFIPGDELNIEIGYIGMIGQRFVLRVTLPNGAIKIIGSPQEPLDFRLTSNTGTTVPSRAGSGFSFTGNTTKRALFVV